MRVLGENHPGRAQAARPPPAEAEGIELPVSAGAAAGPGSGALDGQYSRAGEEAEDPELVAYNAYLARLNQQVKGHGKWHGLR